MRTNRTVAERAFAAFLCLILVLGMFPVRTSAEETAAAYGSVVAATQGITVSGSGTDKISATNSDMTLNWTAADASIGRDRDGWWVGLNLYAPAGMTAEQLKNVKYGYTADNLTLSFWDNKDSQDAAQSHYIGLWAITNETYLKENKVTYNWYISWDGTNVQHIQLKLDPGKVVLKDAQGNGVYPVYGTVVPVTSGVTVTGGNGTEAVTVSNGDMTLNWTAADASIGRDRDGWWAGLNLYAPAGMTAEQLKNVKYGYTADNLALSFWDNKDSQDAAQNHYIGLWAITNETNLKENKVTYNWYISWDGTSVQHIQLKLDPAKVKLQENADIAYGTVAAIKPADAVVSGNGSSAITVAVEKAELTWVEADEKLGREAGWWVGIKVIAPEGFSENAQYMVNDSGTGKSFATYKDGDDYIELWFKVTDTTLIEDEDRKLTMNYAFDWNGNGIYEQTIQFYVNADGDILLKNAAGQQVYPYLYGTVYASGEISNNATRTVTVDMKGWEATWDNGWEISVKATLNGQEKIITATFNSVDETDVDVTEDIDWNDDGLVDQTIKLTGKVKLLKAEQKAPVFENVSLSIDSEKLNAEGAENAVTNADEAVGEVVYTIAENDYLTIDAQTGKVSVAEGQWKNLLKVLKEDGSFTVAVTATFSETGTHNSSAASYNLTLNPKEDESLSFAEQNVTIIFGDQTGKVNTYNQEPVSENGTIASVTYVSSDDTVATVAADGTVTPVKADNVTITATVTYESGYTETVASYNLTIVKGEQAPLVFGNSQLEITFNDNGNLYTNVATGGTTGNAVEYQIVSGADVADIAGSNLTIKSSGTVTVQATMPGNDGYEDVSATYTLTVKKAEQKIALETAEAAVKNSQTEYAIVMVPETGWISAGQDYKFEIIEQDDTVTDTVVDATTGVITIDEGDYGKVVVKVTRPGDNCFLDWEGLTFTLNIQQIDADAGNFQFAGDKHKGAADAQWFCGPVTVTYEADSVKYQVSTGTSKNGPWVDSYTVSEDGIHNPILSLKSTQEHGGIHYAQDVPTIKIDQTAPVSTIEYTETVWGKVFETLTFGFYDAKTSVKITAADGDGDVSGVYAIYYKLVGDTDFTEVKNNVAVVEIDDQYIGKVEFYAVDKAGNAEDHRETINIVTDSTEATWDVKYVYDKNVEEGKEVYIDENGVQYTRFNTTVTLTVEETFFDLSLNELQVKEEEEASAKAPVISGEDAASDWVKGEDGTWSIDLSLTSEGVHDMSMEYTNRSNLASEKYSQKIVIDRSVPVCEIEWDDAERVEDDGTRYYKDSAEKPATATITVTDANFNPANTVITDTILLVNGTEEKKELTAEWKQDEKDATVWTAVITLDEERKQEGTHNLTVDTTDWAGNVMETKTTDKVVLDYTAPVLEELVFSGATVKNSKDGRDYYKEVTTVTITVTERNFSKEDLQNGIALKAQDVTGADISAAYTLGEWKKDGDKYTIDLTFAADANFTLDVSYADKANNAGNDVTEKLFTVDKVAPRIVGITYSKSLQDVIIETITFSYYRAPMEVTLRVEDETAGVQQFDYSALLNANVSKVNAPIENAIATNVKQDGKIFYVTFKIPAEALTNTTQFNGYVQFTATDWSANTSAMETHKDKQSVVVDNISPKATVTYNEPVQTVEKVAYYDKEIQVSIAINEANFFANDVQIAVTRNGANYAVTPRWTGGAGDVHTGTFTLTQDGDYIIKVTYTDRSGNEMVDYTSHQLTLDTVLPTVEVTNVVANSANTDAVYTFDIIASDINIDPATFKPVLTGVFRDAEGKFVTKTIDLGDMTVVKKDETYSFTVKNLEEDAIYTLTCSVSDLAKNTYEKMVLKDEKEYEEVQFSINRNGSTYMLDDNTTELVGNYYVQNVNNNVVLIEINPDVLEEHAVTLNGRDLADGDDYSVREEGGNGSWMKYTYSVNKDLMTDESEYNLVISSEDKAGNKAFSDVKGASIGFVVDRTAPVVTVTGMHNDGRYQVESQTVTLIPMDAGGALKSLAVYLVDDDGNVLQQLIDLSGEELYTALEENEDQITFEIGEGLYQNVRVVCTDMAVDETGATNAYDETFTNISVSTSGFMIFWANKPLRYGVIFGTLGLAALVLFLIFGKKKKA